MRLQKLKTKFEAQYGVGTFEVVEVADATAPEAYDEALKGGPRPEAVTDLHLGASGFLHVATDSSFSTDTDKVSHCLALCQSDAIGQVYNDSVAFTLNALKSAAKTPSVKRVVLTSSRIAVYALKSGDNVDIKDSSVYNEEYYDLAWKTPVDDPMKAVFACTSSFSSAPSVYRLISSHRCRVKSWR